MPRGDVKEGLRRHILATACASAPPPPVAAPGSDDFQIQAALLAVYNVISGPAARRDWNRFTPLFAPGARLISTRITDGAPVTTVMTPEEFSKSAQTYFAEHGFFERPINNRIERFRDIAQVWSTYESRNASADETPFARTRVVFGRRPVADDGQELRGSDREKRGKK